jgi:phosphoglucosamine mutase
MAMCAVEMMANGKLPGNKLVATVMSNMALEVFMREKGGVLLRTQVGDRYVMEEMLKEGAMFGGEQSGHLIFREYSTTGDGLLAALQILRIMREKEKPLSELAGQLAPYPQTLLNVRVAQKLPFDQRPDILAAKEKVEQELADRGRVLLRYSGTEPVCRVMVEGENNEEVRRYAEDLADVVQRSLK